jgi:large subunit ribosomal protein L17
MRHGVSQRKLGRTTAHRVAMLRNQIASLVANERIVTTLPKAKELRPIAERVITQGKLGTVHARRIAQRWLADRDLLKKLFDVIAPRMKERAGGYLRIVKLGPRPGDAAELAVLELVDYQLPAKTAKPDKDKKGKEAAAQPAESESGAEKPKKEKKAKADKPAKGKKSMLGPGGRADAHAKGGGAKKGSTPRKAGTS